MVPEMVPVRVAVTAAAEVVEAEVMVKPQT
jgi:hypothetical protein